MAVVRLFLRDRWRRTRKSNVLLGYYARVAQWILRIKVRALGKEHIQRGALYVGNHLSYADVLVLSPVLEGGFVTSVEIKHTPGLGLICQMAGCLFVERRNRSGLRNEISELREGLQVGLNVTIFPEATSSNGEQILRFKKPLYLAAVAAGRPVIPFCLNYRRVGGQPINKVTRDSVCWYGDMDFLPHLISLAGSGGVEVDLNILPPLETGLQMEAGELAEKSQAAIEKVFIPVS